MKKIVSVLMLVFALILGGCGGSGGLDLKQEDYKFDNLQTQLNNINLAINGDTDVIAGIQDNVTALQLDVEALKAQIAAFSVDVETNAAAIAELQAECDAKQLVIDGMLEDIAALQAEVKELQSELFGFQEQLTDLKESVDKNTADIAALQADVDALYDKVCGLSKKICVLFSKFNALAGAAATFGLTPPVGDLGVGFYLDVSSGFVYQFVEGVWVKIGQLQVAQATSLKAPMFVVAEKVFAYKVKITWTPVDGAVGYVVYAMKYDDYNDTITTAAVGKTTSYGDTSVTIENSVFPIPLSPPTPWGKATELAYVVVAVDANGNQGISSYAVGPLTGDFRGF